MGKRKIADFEATDDTEDYEEVVEEDDVVEEDEDEVDALEALLQDGEVESVEPIIKEDKVGKKKGKSKGKSKESAVVKDKVSTRKVAKGDGAFPYSETSSAYAIAEMLKKGGTLEQLAGKLEKGVKDGKIKGRKKMNFEARISWMVSDLRRKGFEVTRDSKSGKLQLS